MYSSNGQQIQTKGKSEYYYTISIEAELQRLHNISKDKSMEFADRQYTEIKGHHNVYT